MAVRVYAGKVARHAKVVPQESHPPKRTQTLRIFITLLLVLAGVMVLLYPVAATQWNNYRQTEVARQYEKYLHKDADPAVASRSLEEAKEYNATLAGTPVVDPWEGRVAEDNEPYQHYLSLLSQAPAMGRLVLPTINVDLPVFHGTSSRTLDHGIGHLYGTALPVGGEGTRTVLTGHTGLRTATLMDNLDKMKEGDPIYISVMGERLKYEVNHIEVVLPSEYEKLRPVPGEDLITLVTCTPYGINSHRLLVTGHRVPLEKDDEKAFKTDGSALHFQWWMWAILVGVIVVLVVLVVWIRRNAR